MRRRQLSIAITFVYVLILTLLKISNDQNQMNSQESSAQQFTLFSFLSGLMGYINFTPNGTIREINDHTIRRAVENASPYQLNLSKNPPPASGMVCEDKCYPGLISGNGTQWLEVTEESGWMALGYDVMDEKTGQYKGHVDLTATEENLCEKHSGDIHPVLSQSSENADVVKVDIAVGSETKNPSEDENCAPWGSGHAHQSSTNHLGVKVGVPIGGGVLALIICFLCAAKKRQNEQNNATYVSKIDYKTDNETISTNATRQLRDYAMVAHYNTADVKVSPIGMLPNEVLKIIGEFLFFGILHEEFGGCSNSGHDYNSFFEIVYKRYAESFIKDKNGKLRASLLGETPKVPLTKNIASQQFVDNAEDIDEETPLLRQKY